MVRLAVDVMGGDHGIATLVKGAVLALQKNPSIQILFVGDASQVRSCDGVEAHSDRIEYLDTPVYIDMNEKPLAALKNGSESSMAKAIAAVSEGSVAGAISAGNTGALVALAVKLLGMRDIIGRPAICTQVPVKCGSTWLLDMGAMLTADEDRLLALASLGAEQCKKFNGIDRPRVGLLNVGTETAKGLESIQKAALLMENAPAFEYRGYVEGNTIFSGDFDVVVCDGFSGNIAIKAAQGIAGLINEKAHLLAQESLLSRIRMLFAKPGFEAVAKHVSPTLYNGAPLLGLNGLVVKSHGSATPEAFSNAVLVAARTAQATAA